MISIIKLKYYYNAKYSKEKQISYCSFKIAIIFVIALWFETKINIIINLNIFGLKEYNIERKEKINNCFFSIKYYDYKIEQKKKI